jgi:hypothetical protein
MAQKKKFFNIDARLGNDFIHRLTNEAQVVLRVELTDFDNVMVVAEYSTFRCES